MVLFNRRRCGVLLLQELDAVPLDGQYIHIELVCLLPLKFGGPCQITASRTLLIVAIGLTVLL